MGRPAESESWQRAAFFGDRILWVTPEELAAVGRQLAAVFAAGTLSIVFNVAAATLFVSLVEPGQYVDGQTLVNGTSGRACSA